MGSYGAASRRLHVTPSAVSHAMGRLRESLGAELVEWRGRRFSLTEEGDHLFAVCERIFDELEQAELRMSSGRGEAVHHFSLGATTEFGATVLLQRMKPLLQAHQTLHIDFRFSNELIAPLLRDELDLIVDCRPHQHPVLQRHHLFREKYVVVVAPRFLERQRIRTPLDLAKTPVLSLDREGTWWNNLIATLAPRRRPILGRVVVIDSVRGMINGALAEYGVALLPKYAVLREIADGSLLVLFPRLKLLEDSFCIYQKLARAERPANQLVTRFLLGLDIRELGDAIGARAVLRLAGAR